MIKCRFLTGTEGALFMKQLSRLPLGSLFLSLGFVLLMIAPVWPRSSSKAEKEEGEEREGKKEGREKKSKESRKEKRAAEEEMEKAVEKAAEKAAEKIAEKVKEKVAEGAEEKPARSARPAVRRKPAESPPEAGQDSPASPAASADLGGGLGAGGAKIVDKSHVLYLRDGTKLYGTVLMEGSRSVIVLTEEGEVEFDPAAVERIGPSGEGNVPVYAATEIRDGHEYLTPPQEPAEDAESAAGDSAGPPVPDASPAPAPTPSPAPAAEAPPAAAKPGTPKPEKKAAVLDQVEALRAAKAQADAKAEKPADTATPAKGQNFTDLLKALESKEGVNNILERLKDNPDFFKDVNLSK